MISALRISNHDRTVFAGSSPATAGLAFMLSICRELHSQIPRTAQSAPIRTNSLALPAPKSSLHASLSQILVPARVPKSP